MATFSKGIFPIRSVGEWKCSGNGTRNRDQVRIFIHGYVAKVGGVRVGLAKRFGAWTLTHIPSGLALSNYATKKEAEQAAPEMVTKLRTLPAGKIGEAVQAFEAIERAYCEYTPGMKPPKASKHKQERKVATEQNTPAPSVSVAVDNLPTVSRRVVYVSEYQNERKPRVRMRSNSYSDYSTKFAA